MAVDKRLPAVYVDVEDRSYVSTAVEAGRTAYCVLISDRGPHNQIVELNSQQDLYDLFGQPNFTKYGQGHYFIDQHLKRSGKIYVVRPVILEPMVGMTRDDCAAIANAKVHLNQTTKASVQLNGNFKIIGGSNVITVTDPNGEVEIMPKATFSFAALPKLEAGDLYSYTYNSVPTGTVELTSSNINDMKSAQGWTTPDGLNMQYNAETEILTLTTVNKNDVVTDPKVILMPRTGGVTVLPDETVSNQNAAVFRIAKEKGDDDPTVKTGWLTIGDRIDNLVLKDRTAELSGVANPPRLTVTINITADNIEAMQLPGGWYDRVNNVKVMYAEASGALTITPYNTTSNTWVIESYGQYIDRDVPLTIPGNTLDYVPAIPPLTPGSYADIAINDYIIVDNYLGEQQKYRVLHVDSLTGITIEGVAAESYAGPVRKISNISVTHMEYLINPGTIDQLDEDVLWTFYTIGAGKYYNDLYIKGVRNSIYDRMYTDEDGNAEYPYAFMDIAIYRDNRDGTTTMLEGPWTVSLIEKTSKEVIIKDIYTGLQMYLPDVINRKSKLVRVVESRAVDHLTTMNVKTPYDPDTAKRQWLQNLLNGSMTDYPNGIELAGGSDGNMFDEMGRLNNSDQVKSIVMQAYNGSLPSLDGSIQKLLAVVYPWYIIDYIYCGGWDHDVNYAALELAEIRQDCLLLADTGAYKETHTEDIEARRTLVPWNTWNAALYTNYRQIFDEFTSKYFYVSPIYHAIDRHLYVDDVYWIAEPVAGIEKGAIEQAIKLAYSTSETQLADELDAELNPVLIETDGTYILQQFTTWKRLSVMKRQHVVKFVHYCKKSLPTELKDILHRKATTYWLNEAQSRVDSFMLQFVDTGVSDRYAAITSYSSQVTFDEEAAELNVILTIHPLRSIERINVSIIVT